MSGVIWLCRSVGSVHRALCRFRSCVQKIDHSIFLCLLFRICLVLVSAASSVYSMIQRGELAPSLSVFNAILRVFSDVRDSNSTLQVLQYMIEQSARHTAQPSGSASPDVPAAGEVAASHAPASSTASAGDSAVSSGGSYWPSPDSNSLNLLLTSFLDEPDTDRLIAAFEAVREAVPANAQSLQLVADRLLRTGRDVSAVVQPLLDNTGIAPSASLFASMYYSSSSLKGFNSRVVRRLFERQVACGVVLDKDSFEQKVVPFVKHSQANSFAPSDTSDNAAPIGRLRAGKVSANLLSPKEQAVAFLDKLLGLFTSSGRDTSVQLEQSTMLFQITREIRQAASLKDALAIFEGIGLRKLKSGASVRILVAKCLLRTCDNSHDIIACRVLN